MDADQKKILKAFYSDGYKIGMEALKDEVSPDTLYPAIQKLHAALDDFIDAFLSLSAQSAKPMACKKGCEWCCHQPIYALSYEMEYLNHFVKKNFDDEKVEEIKNRAAQKNKKFSALDEKDLQNAKHPCPLLENGSCLAYAARPVACRIYLSATVDSCLSFFNSPADENSIPALADFPLRAGKMMNEGFKSALKAAGLPAREFRIEEILLVLPVAMEGSLDEN